MTTVSYLRILVLFAAMISFLRAPAFCGCQAELEIFEIKYGNVETIYEIANSLKSAEGKITYDRKTRKLVVFDCPENINRVLSVIEDMDVQEKQVEINVLVVETTSQTLENIGIPSGSVIIPENRFAAIAELLKTDKDSSTRSKMTLRTISSTPAVLQVARDEVIGMETIIDQGTVVTTPVRESIGNSLEVLPVVNNDGSIKVILRPSVSDMEEMQAPSERTIITSVVINDGDTIAIGGVDIGSSSREKDIAFQKDKTRTEKIEMFLTVKIVD